MAPIECSSGIYLPHSEAQIGKKEQILLFYQSVLVLCFNETNVSVIENMNVITKQALAPF